MTESASRAASSKASRTWVRSSSTPLLLPGIQVKTGSDDGYPIEAMQIQRFEGENWKLEGEVIQAPH
jgi:hypothetical protein